MFIMKENLYIKKEKMLPPVPDILTGTSKSWPEIMLASHWCGCREAVAEQHRIDLWKKKKNCEKCQTWKDAIDPYWNNAD